MLDAICFNFELFDQLGGMRQQDFGVTLGHPTVGCSGTQGALLLPENGHPALNQRQPLSVRDLGLLRWGAGGSVERFPRYLERAPGLATPTVAPSCAA
jgi:hypothetical protein